MGGETASKAEAEVEGYLKVFLSEYRCCYSATEREIIHEADGEKDGPQG